MIHLFSCARKRWLLLLFLLIGSAGIAQTEPLTLQSAMKYAIEHYSTARKARLDVENSQYKIDETRGKALPQVSANGGITYNPLLQLSAIPAELSPTGTSSMVAFGTKWNANMGVTLNQTLYDQSVFIGLKAADATRAYYQLVQQQTEEEVLKQVAIAYYQLLVQKQKMIVADTNIQMTGAMQGVIKGQFENGLAKRIDLDRITVNLNNLESQRRQLINDVTIKENQLKFYMGMSLQDSIVINEGQLSQIKPHFELESDTLDTHSRIDYQVLKKQEELQVLKKASVVAGYYPTLNLQGNYSYQRLSNNFPLAKSGSNNPQWFDVASVGLNLKIPIFSGGSTRAKVRQAETDIKLLQEDMRALTLSLNMAYANARSQVNNSVLTINSHANNLKLAQHVYTDTRNNYNLGLATLTDLLDARNQLTDAQYNYTNALLDYKVAEIQLLTSKGQIQTLLK